MSDLSKVGTDPDPRFTLANERTFLAWNRTALALIGGGLAVGQLVKFHSTSLRLIVALPPVALGAAIALISPREWERNERALRLGEPLPMARPRERFLGGGIFALAIIVTVVVVIDALR
jgi:putative membrane protein